MPESKLHLELRTAVYLFLRLAFGERASVGSEQFVYWNPREPRKCLAPDAMLKLGSQNDVFATWKTWERGAPDVAVEIVSSTDARTWDSKLDEYHELGVRELVRFDPEAAAGNRLEVWDLIDGDLAPREITGDAAESRLLEGHFWVVRPYGSYEAALRLAVGSPSGVLVPTPEEREALRADAAERRIAELEAELAKRG